MQPSRKMAIKMKNQTKKDEGGEKLNTWNKKLNEIPARQRRAVNTI